jgi:glycosyltransferase involved in cell wall biosynthesis
MLRPPLVFAFPEGSDAPSGGNVYNLELTQALAELVPLTVTSFAEAETRLARGEFGIYFFDSLDLEKVGTLPAPRDGQRLGLLVHHLPSLEPGLSPNDPALAREAAALARFALFVATSDFTRDWLVARGHAASRFLTVPPALSEPKGAPRSYEPPLSALVVANLVPRKGVFSLLTTLEAMAPSEAPFALRIVGRDDIDPAHAEQCRRLVARVTWLRKRVSIDGPLPHDSMSDAYERAHLLVSASSMETFGMAIHEARAHGLVVLAREGGYVRRHFDDGAVGRLVESDRELARELVRLAGDEPGMRALFSSAQNARVEPRPTWATAARMFLRELDRLLLC